MKAAFSLGALLALSLSATAQMDTYMGCHSSPGNLTDQGSNQYQSVGLCGQVCAKVGAPFAGLQDSHCWCGVSPPVPSTFVSGKECNTQCPGYPADTCGGTGVWSVYQLGITADPDDGGNGDGPPNGNGGGPNNGDGDGDGDGPGYGSGNGPPGNGGGPETTTASSFTVYPTPAVASTTASQSASWASTSAIVSTARASPTTATSGASRRFRFLFF
ncbi:WSC-domain-containing protein [Aspergillus sclerotioniger CBS 115572]|uniref:WSC-domain-containing protein n=1 Tax=Aspergillus sclerotioniger CBS 115572 TaxID=1450535 RepID=A0A317VR03_9EURO|nr:WSC-domain-containing protein [Aspergillus sclerotioniger CBS 115572]PWY75989.1 WSC-domain-containing protein [Aspergillus sclerotioniger CBS 115572]